MRPLEWLEKLLLLTVPAKRKESVSWSYDQKHNYKYGLGMTAKSDTKLLPLRLQPDQGSNNQPQISYRTIPSDNLQSHTGASQATGTDKDVPIFIMLIINHKSIHYATFQGRICEFDSTLTWTRFCLPVDEFCVLSLLGPPSAIRLRYRAAWCRVRALQPRDVLPPFKNLETCHECRKMEVEKRDGRKRTNTRVWKE